MGRALLELARCSTCIVFNLSITQPVLHSVAIRAVERTCATACSGSLLHLVEILFLGLRPATSSLIFLFWLIGQLCRMGLGFKVHSYQMDQPFFETTLARLELHLGGACMQVNHEFMVCIALRSSCLAYSAGAVVQSQAATAIRVCAVSSDWRLNGMHSPGE